MSIPLANAPVSFGVWGPHTGPAGVPGSAVLGAVAAAGYAGSELGPPGYLGSTGQTAQAFLDHGLQAAGVYVGLSLRDRDGLSRPARDGLDDVCRSVVEVARRAIAAGAPQSRLPLGPIVLSDGGDNVLRDHPARDPADPAERRLALDADAWRTAARIITEAHELISGYGLATSFHPHLSTYVEARWEVERLLETTQVAVTLDTGHLRLAGADPVQCLRDWESRVDHVHLKDVDLGVLHAARRDGRRRIDEWWGDACVGFGSGDVDLGGVLAGLVADAYGGWIVVEQDHTPVAGDTVESLGARQKANLDWLIRTLAEVSTA